MKNALVFLLAVLCVIYLLNPGAGLFELLPDTLPLVGNLDEGLAVALLVLCLEYFGVKLPDIFTRRKK